MLRAESDASVFHEVVCELLESLKKTADAQWKPHQLPLWAKEFLARRLRRWANSMRHIGQIDLEQLALEVGRTLVTDDELRAIGKI
jgi:hypothetical protein